MRADRRAEPLEVALAEDVERPYLAVLGGAMLYPFLRALRYSAGRAPLDRDGDAARADIVAAAELLAAA